LLPVAFREWGDAFAGNCILSGATLDRLRHSVYRVVAVGENLRTPKPMPEPARTQLAKSAKKHILSNPRFTPLLIGAITGLITSIRYTLALLDAYLVLLCHKNDIL
jgi:hypothetical protein